jgi:N-acyl homoserine lactone hydrolase
MSRPARILTALVAVAAVTGILLMRGFAAAPLPSPPMLSGSLPVASPPAGMALYQLPTGTIRRSAGFAYRGGSFGDVRDFAMTALLVRHPRGDLLIDTGFGSRIDEQFRMLVLPFQWLTSYERGTTAAGQLRAAGYRLDEAPAAAPPSGSVLRGIVLTHAHWDHVSGVSDFPSTPVWVSAAEHESIADGGFVTAVARSIPGAKWQQYTFVDQPYLGFTRHFDVYGDGSVVLVPAPGHTPGSIIVFLATPDGRRYALVGDLVWQTEGILQREERPWLLRRLADADEVRVREQILKMAAVAAKFPEIVLVPAHDARAFAGIPLLEPLGRDAAR